MGSKQKRKIARLQREVVHMRKRKEAAVDAGLGCLFDLEVAKESHGQTLLQKSRENNRLREELADERQKASQPPYPMIVSFRSFMEAMGKLPESPRKVWGPDLDCIVPSVASPDGSPDAVHINLLFKKTKVIPHGFSKTHVYGWMVPAGVVVVDMNPRDG